jgi:hypothetical protein
MHEADLQKIQKLKRLSFCFFFKNYSQSVFCLYDIVNYSFTAVQLYRFVELTGYADQSVGHLAESTLANKVARKVQDTHPQGKMYSQLSRLFLGLRTKTLSSYHKTRTNKRTKHSLTSCQN